MLQTQVEVVDFGFVEFRIALQDLQPFEVEGAERSLFAEHRPCNGSAVTHAKVGQFDGIQFAKRIGEVETWHEVHFVQATLQVGDLGIGEIIHQINLAAANEHVRHLQPGAGIA